MARIVGLSARIQKEKMKEALGKKGYVFFENGNYNLNIIGIRNNSGRPDVFDDFINVFYKINTCYLSHFFVNYVLISTACEVLT